MFHSMGFDYPFVLLPYDDRWKERRRMFVQNFKPADTFIFHPQAREFTHRLLSDLKHDPEDFFEIIKGYVLHICWTGLRLTPVVLEP